jgi:hypothetical protein
MQEHGEAGSRQGEADSQQVKVKLKQMLKEPPNWQQPWRRRRESPTALRKKLIMRKLLARCMRLSGRKIASR